MSTRDLTLYVGETAELFSSTEKKFGREFLKIESVKQTFVDLFAAVDTESLRVLDCLPNDYFKSLITDELEARRTKARLLKTRGRLHRRERQVCLV